MTPTLTEARWNAARAVLRGRQGEPALARLGPGEQAPACYAQEGLWLADRRSPGSTAYNLTVAFRLRGPLDVRALEQSLLAVVRRHEILRTSFMLDDGLLLQQVAPAAAAILQLEDVSASEVASWVSARARRPFDLGRGPLFRADLAKIAADDHCLVLSSHHAVLDAWSFEILMHEICTFYEACASGTPLSLPAPARQYRDFAAWQRRRLQGALSDSLVAYWRAALPADAPVLALPTDRPRRSMTAGRGASQSRVYGAGLTASLRSLAGREQTTLFALLSAALGVLLHRYTGDTDIVIGAPVAVRNRPELTDMLGMLINTVPLRTRLDAGSTFRELLAQTGETVTQALAHQELPFELLVRALGRSRRASAPLFQVMFAFQNVPRSRWRFAGLDCDAWNVEPEHAKLDLTLTMQERDDGLGALLAYDADLFDAATINRMLGHFENLLAAIVAEPDRPIAALAMLAPSERSHVLAAGRGHVLPCRTTVHRLFEAQVRKTPDLTALVSDQGDRLSYRELNQRANRLARRLARLGIGRGALVGIELPRSPSLIVAQLGILKAGAAYVPIPAAPPLRLQRLWQRLAAVVTDDASKVRAASFGGRVIDVTDVDLAAHSGEDLDVDGTPDDLAYVMFTSGSTGEPRGVAVPHRGVARLSAGASYLRLTSDEVFLHLAPATFDAATFEVWCALLAGATLALAPDRHLSVAEIGAVVARHRVTTLWLTAGLFEAVVDDGLAGLATLRRLLTGGDVVSVGHARHFRERWPACRLFNCYGPTENTTFSTVYDVTTVGDEHSIPVGRPIANTSVYLLDGSLQPVPPGVIGEAYLGGDGVAQGYLGDEAATRARFVPSPFVEGETLYRSGDRMRLRADGELEFAGRVDDQLKIRGFRVEPVEVEQALAACSGVRSALVRAEGDSSGRKRLCAYVVTSDEDPALPAKLQAALRTTLPAYMVPTSITRVAAFSTTGNGKRTLPTALPPAPPVACSLPRNHAEQVVAQVFSKILATESIGSHDSFFDLGGDSLGAIRVVSLLERRLGRELPLSMLYDNPSVATLARALSVGAAKPPSSEAGLMVLKAGRSTKPLFLIGGGRGGKPELTLCAKLVSRLGEDETVYGLLAPSVARSVDEVAELNVEIIRRVQPAGPYRVGGECIGGIVAYAMAQRLLACGQEVELLLLLDTFCPSGQDDVPRTSLRRVLSPRRSWNTARDLLRAGVAFLAELPGRGADAPPWPLELWRRLTVSAEAKRHIQACMRYRPSPYPGSVVIFASADSLQRGLAEPWKALVGGGLTIRAAAGDHDTYSRRYYRQTSEELRRCLQDLVKGGHGD